MNKLTIASLFLLFTLPEVTQAHNWYVQGDIGQSKIKSVGINKGILNDQVTDLRLSLGHKFGNFRAALDYTRYGKASTSLEDGDTVTLKTNSLGFSYIYDFQYSPKLNPFLGIRLSYNKYTASLPRYIELENNSTAGIGVLGGIQYKLSKQLSLNTNLEYNRMSVDIGQFGAKVGLRFDF